MVVQADDVDQQVDEDTTGADVDNDDDDEDEDNEPVTFDNKKSFAAAVNKIVKQRLARNDKKYAPIIQERDTLKSKVTELTTNPKGVDGGNDKSDPRVEAMAKQLEELTNYRANEERSKLVRRVAKDKGLPEEFIARIQGDDEDAITEDVESFLEVLKPIKRTPKETKPVDKTEGKGSKGAAGGNGSDSDEKVDPRKLANKVGRYGRNPYIVGNP